MGSKSRKFRIATGTLTLPEDISTADDIIIEEEQDVKTSRQKLNKFLNLISVQSVIVTVIVLDVLLVLFLLLMELQVIQVPPSEQQSRLSRRDVNGTGCSTPSDSVDQVETVMHIIQLVVLSLFMTEVILRVVAKGIDLVYDRWQVFDSLVVLVTFALYVSLTASVKSRISTYSVGFAIILRLWRIGRINYDLTQPVIQKARNLILGHRRAWRHTEEELKHERIRVDRLQAKVETLKNKLRSLSKNHHTQTFSSPALSSYSNVDPVSSEDETSQESKISTNRSTVVHMEPTTSFRALRSRSLPSTTPRGSFETDSSISLPGSPKSMSYHFKTQPKMLSHGSSGRIPDLVEHTLSADLVRDPSFKEALTLQALALDTGKLGASKHNKNNGKKSQTLDVPQRNPVSNHNDIGVFVGKDSSPSGSGNKYKKNRDRGSQNNKHGHRIRERSASADNLAHKDILNGDISSHFRDRSVMRGDGSNNHRGKHGEIKNGPNDSKLYPSEGGDKAQLLSVTTHPMPADFAFCNPSFSSNVPEGGLTEEELVEIQRVSRVPFDPLGSISHLLKEGIPISEL